MKSVVVFEERTHHNEDIDHFSFSFDLVNGGWSKWSEWSVCTHPCMVKLRTRECNNPTPESGGLNCTGSKVEQYPCGSAVECQCKTIFLSSRDLSFSYGCDILTMWPSVDPKRSH